MRGARVTLSIRLRVRMHSHPLFLRTGASGCGIAGDPTAICGAEDAALAAAPALGSCGAGAILGVAAAGFSADGTAVCGSEASWERRAFDLDASPNNGSRCLIQRVDKIR